MWLIKNTGLLTDLYELTMAQAYFKNNMNDRAFFEVTVRALPDNWGFFVMAGLAELAEYLDSVHFSDSDIDYLRSTRIFEKDFLDFLADFKPQCEIRALPEGTAFFPQEPCLEVAGPLINAQMLETAVLNILGFSIAEATLAARVRLAAKDTAVVDFGLRRSQGPVASLRAARAAKIAGFKATSNVLAAKMFDFAPSGTMAHSFVEVHPDEEESFENFARLYRENAILLVDTFDTIEGIKKAAAVAKRLYETEGIKISGVRIDSGDLVELSNFAEKHFNENGAEFLKIFVSGDLDEYKIADLLARGAKIDGIGIGTRFAVSHHAPAISVIYKIVQYGRRKLYKTSPAKQSYPGRKSIDRQNDDYYRKDIVSELQQGDQDLLKAFKQPEPTKVIQARLANELARLADEVKAITNPATYPVEITY